MVVSYFVFIDYNDCLSNKQIGIDRKILMDYYRFKTAR